MESSQQHSWIARWALIAGIVIVINMFFNYALSLVYKAPSYDAFISQPQIVENYTQALCISVGGQWTATAIDLKSTDLQTKNGGYCDPDYTKRMEYDRANKAYERVVFIALTVLGIATLIAGIFIANSVLALAFAWGGVLSLVIASIRYWSEANSLIRVLILAVALGALIWTAVKKFDKA